MNTQSTVPTVRRALRLTVALLCFSVWAPALAATLPYVPLVAAEVASAQSLDSPQVRAKAKKRNRGIDIKITVPRSLKKKAMRRTLSIVLARDTGSGFVSIVQFDRPKKTSSYRDQSVTSGTVAYRAVISSPVGTSAWSTPAVVSLGSSSGGGDSGGGGGSVGGGGGTGVGPGGGSGSGSATDCHDIPLPAGISECPSGYETQVLDAVNAQRGAQGTAPLAANRALNCAARSHTIWMIQNNNFSHDGWTTFIRNAGYAGGALGENIALGYPTPSAVMSGWMNSPGHRANILNAGYRDLGVSCLTGGGAPWWTQDFGG